MTFNRSFQKTRLWCLDTYIYIYINYNCFIVESNIFNVAYVCINYIMKSYARTYTKNGAHVCCEYIKVIFVFMYLFLVIIVYKTWKYKINNIIRNNFIFV